MDELIKRLRNRRICIQQSGSLDDFPLLREAADAIEELQKRVPPIPHGRLIDADAVYKRLQKQAMSVWGDGNPRYQIVLDVMDAIRFAPTIIPASGGKVNE